MPPRPAPKPADLPAGGEYVQVALESVTPYPGNAWIGNIAAIARSLQEHQQYKPIVVQKSTRHVLAGNHTREAALSIGWTHLDARLVECDDAEAHQINLIDNRSQQLGGYDDAALLAQLQAYPTLTGTGFEPDDLAALLAKLDPDNSAAGGKTEPDDVPDRPTTAISQLGDTWLLGRHRLHVGDATSDDAWTRLLAGDQADLIWTDPPYGVSYVGKTKDKLTIDNDALEGPALQAFLGAAFDNAVRHLNAGAGLFVAAPAGPLFADFAAVLGARDLWRQTLVWLKDQFVMGRSDYHYRHEAIFYGWKPGASHHPPPDRTQDTIWEVPRPRRSTEHPTMKPVALITRAIENSTDPGQLVADPFAGSGSTLLACHGTGRRAALLELDPIYADVILRRWFEHTGIAPKHAVTGVEFPSVERPAA